MDPTICIIKQHMVGIYKITNPNGKVYIGQAINIDKRIQKYKWISAIQKQPKINS
jgi:excinuclease UvrABC nuclease subunit